MSHDVQCRENRIVAHFKNGKLLKGYTENFVPAQETFRLRSAYGKDRINTYEVRTTDLKALFFVKTLEGNKEYSEKREFDGVGTSNIRGTKIKAVFADGEVIRGANFDYSKIFNGFYITPIDPQSNNERVYVVKDSTRNIVVGSAAKK
ncbi:unnamed protein product [marine sediment metagenome]|uniref:Uncharacterized protein n=1 Tax=marine sediment metagenome TaxID=412755 RepID=X1DPQ0_9ZZZZ